MKPLTIAIRLLGICVALWFLYTAVTMWVSIYSQVLAADEVRPIQDHSKTLLIDFFVTKPLPFVCFAILLLLPYGRLNRIVELIGLSCALLWLGFYSWREIFGIFFFSSRLVFEVIPLPVIAYTAAFLLFLLAFVSTIILNKQNSRTDGPNSHAFGTFGTSAAEQPLVPKASGSRSSRTFGNLISLSCNSSH
jgi:hypothetical protein